MNIKNKSCNLLLVLRSIEENNTNIIWRTFILCIYTWFKRLIERNLFVTSFDIHTKWYNIRHKYHFIFVFSMTVTENLETHKVCHIIFPSVGKGTFKRHPRVSFRIFSDAHGVWVHIAWHWTCNILAKLLFFCYKFRIFVV